MYKCRYIHFCVLGSKRPLFLVRPSVITAGSLGIYRFLDLFFSEHPADNIFIQEILFHEPENGCLRKVAIDASALSFFFCRFNFGKVVSKFCDQFAGEKEK